MKSVGEVIAIGRTFAESLQKALRGLETGLTGLDEVEIPAPRATDPGRSAGGRALGLSDARLATLPSQTEKEVRAARRALDVRPVFKRIDSCAAEFAAATHY